ncbi:hypothetical protein [Rubritalea tangerina]
MLIIHAATLSLNLTNCKNNPTPVSHPHITLTINTLQKHSHNPHDSG